MTKTEKAREIVGSRKNLDLELREKIIRGFL